jgi:Vps53-like, N-terminal
MSSSDGALRHSSSRSHVAACEQRVCCSICHYTFPRVQEICRDIRKLDHAKANLTATITAFRRLSMLVTAVGEAPPTPSF